MLKRFYNKWMFASSPWTSWTPSEGSEAYTIEELPMEVRIAEPLNHDLVKLIGRELLITQVTDTDEYRKTLKRQISFRFPETDRENIDDFAGKYTLGKNIAIRPINLLDTGDNKDRLLPTSDNSYYYFPLGAPDLASIKLYDFAGNEIWRFASGNEANPYGLSIEPGNARISMNDIYPAFGEILATYDAVFYGKIIDLNINPLPGTLPTEFGHQITLKELSWPGVEEYGTYRLYLRDTAADAVSGLGGTGNRLALDTEEGHGDSDKETFRKLSRTPGSSEKLLISSAEGIGASAHFDYGGTWAIQLAKSVIPKGNKFVLAYPIQGYPNSQLAPTASVSGYLYIWRSGVGIIASLLSNDYTHRYAYRLDPWVDEQDPTTGERGGEEIDYLEWGTWSTITGEVLDKSIEVEDGDYLVFELYTWVQPDTVQEETWGVWYDGDILEYPASKGSGSGRPETASTRDGAAQIRSIYPIFLKRGAD